MSAASNGHAQTSPDLETTLAAVATITDLLMGATVALSVLYLDQAGEMRLPAQTKARTTEYLGRLVRDIVTADEQRGGPGRPRV